MSKVRSSKPAAVDPGTAVVGRDPQWWARGLTLAERRAGAPTRADAPTARDLRRLRHWRTATDPTAEPTPDAEPGPGTEPGPDVVAAFARRLAALGLDETGLLALLAESPNDLAARVRRPGWAAEVERMVAGVPERPPLPEGELTWAAGFGAILAPFVTAAADRFASAIALAGDVVDVAALSNGLAAHLSDDLIRLAARTLVLELNVRRLTGRLVGASPRARFASFVGHTAGRGGLAALFGEYPVLARLVAQACTRTVDAQVELVRRFAADRDAIVATLLRGTDPGPLVAADRHGDGHQGGRAVSVLRFASGARVVYKPRPLAGHARFNEALRWLDPQAPGLGLRTLALLVRDGYGWVEFAVHRPCTTACEVADFYRRTGALMALLYAFDATDIHCENLIACGDQPVLVDLETLLHPALPEDGELAADPAAEALLSSVHQTVLLPRPRVGEHGALDVSALGARPGGVQPDDVPGWQAPGTDRMRLVRVTATFAGAQNRPQAGDGPDPTDSVADHVDVLLAGFRVAYDALARHPEALTGPDGLLTRCGGDPVRVVVRPTRVYATMLDESTHPDLLRDALDRDRLLHLLSQRRDGGAVGHRLIRHELAELWAGDIPLVTARPGVRDLWTGRGRRLAGVLPATSLDRAVGKVGRFGPLDRYQQEWVIRASLATDGAPVAHPSGPHRNRSRPVPPLVVPGPDRLFAAAAAIADRIIGRAFPADGRTNWLGVTAVDGRHWALQPLGADLADGYPGVALFLAQVAAVTDVERYRTYARRAVTPIPALLADLAARPDRVRAAGTGGFQGLAGLAYALCRLAALLRDPEIAGWTAAAVNLTAAALAGPAPTTDMFGEAGCLGAMLAVHRATGLPTAGALARRCADRLAAAGSTTPVGSAPAGLGFATGRAGIAWALLRFGGPYTERGLGILDGILDSGPVPGTGLPAGWCNGTAGLVMACAEARVRTTAAAHTAGPGSVPRLDPALAAADECGNLDDHSLCHGELGALDALLVAARTGHRVPPVLLRGRVARLLGAVERYGPRCGTPRAIDSPGLLTGLAGVGYGLLRLGGADRIPSVLLFEEDQSSGGASPGG